MANKVTKKERFMELLNIREVAENAEMVEFINHELELLNKKSTKSGMTANQKVNEGLKEVIAEHLKLAGRAMTITELQSEIEEIAELSNQKVSALLTQLVNDKIVTRTKDKKITTFAIAE